MTLDDIKVFLAIARTGSLTSAAQSLFVSQPALSKRLSRFEEELGAALFERGQGTRKLVLTPAGRLLMPFAEKWDQLQQDFNMLHDINSREHFFVEATDAINACVLPEVIHMFHEQWPEVELVVRQHDSRGCYGSVHDQLCDLALVTQQHVYQDVVATPLWQEEMLLVCADEMGDAPVEPVQLDRKREVMIPWNSEFLHWRQNQLAFSWHPVVSVCNIHQAVPFLLQNRAWTIAPASVAYAAAAHECSLHACTLASPPPPRIVYAIERGSRHHTHTDDLLHLLKKKMKNMPHVNWL